jgi:hypothetical protein
MAKAGNVQVYAIRPPHVARGPPPPFIGQGEAAYSRVAQF